MSELNNMVSKSKITLSATSPCTILTVKEHQVKDIYHQAKTSLASDINSFKIQDFKVMKLIGSGSYGKVFLCVNDKNKHVYAVKRLVKQDIVQNNYASNISNEAKCVK